jgi:hypothetical protein
MVLSSAPTTIHSSGQIVATALPEQITGVPSNVPGGLLNAAAAKTAASIAQQAGHARAAGVTMRGGGTVVNVPPAPEGGSIPGVSFAGNHANLIGAANQLKAGAVYDGLVGSQPYKVGGRRRRGVIPKPHRRRTGLGNTSGLLEREEEPVIAAGRKHTRKTKKHGRRRNSRTHRRKLRKHLRNSRRTSRRIIKR